MDKKERGKVAVRSKNRGKYFEDQVAKLIREAFIKYSNTPGLSDLDSKAIMRRKVWEADHIERGDIVKWNPLVKRVFPFCIECKDVEALPTLDKLISKRNKQWMKYWEQAADQAHLMSEIPMLVWKHGKNATSILCAVPGKVNKELMVSAGKIKLTKKNRMDFYFNAYQDPILIMDFKSELSIYCSEDNLKMQEADMDCNESCIPYLHRLLYVPKRKISYTLLR